MERKLLLCKTIGKLVILLCIVIAVPLLVLYRYPDVLLYMKDRTLLDTYLEAHRENSAWILLVIQFVQVVIAFLPGQVAQFCSGYILGILPGFLICMIGCILGTFAAYGLSELFGKNAISVFFGKEKTERYQEKIKSKRAYQILFLLYLIPMIPKDIIAYVAGFSHISLRNLLFISAVGRAPAMLIGIAMGERLRADNMTGLIVLGLIAVVFIVLCIWKRSEIDAWITKQTNQ